MADNSQIVGGTGDVLKTEDVGAYKIAVGKIYVGAHGVDGGPVTAANPLFVSVTNAVAVTAASLPLPSGAATAAKQPALGVAGTASADVLSVQGATGMTALKVDGSGVTQPVSGTVTDNQGAPAAVANAWPVKLSDGTNLVTLFQTHNTDNQALGGSAWAVNTGGVAQLLNPGGNIDRQRATGVDGVAAVGIASGTQQLASPFSTTSATGPLTAGTRTFTPLAMTGIQVGSVLTLDAAANLENVIVTSVAATTFTCVTLKTHDGSGTPFAIKGFTYNQARDATNPEGSGGTGIPLGATTLFNSTLNSGAGGWENERSASGELDGASGKGTAVAAEYEFNGGGPPLASGLLSGFNFDRARSVNAKGIGSGAITSSLAGDANLVLGSAAATKTLQAGQAVQLTGSGTAETVYPTAAWTPGSSATVPLQSPVVNAGQTTAKWDVYAASGPGLTGFLAYGVGIEEEALYNPADGLFYLERSSTSDAMAGANVVAEHATLYNGATFDRWRGDTTNGAWVNVKAQAALPTGTNTLGYVNAIPAGDTIEIAGVTYTVKRAFANATASGETTVVAAVAAKQIRVLAFAIGPASAAVNVYFDNATSGAISSTKYLSANGGMGRALNPFGHFQTGTVNEALRVNLSATANVGVDVNYIEV